MRPPFFLVFLELPPPHFFSRICIIITNIIFFRLLRYIILIIYMISTMGQVTGIEPVSLSWQESVLAVILYPHISLLPFYRHAVGCCFSTGRLSEFHWVDIVLLTHLFNGAVDETRTRNNHLGRVVPYHWATTAYY